MKTNFSLVFSVRKDGTKTWSAECQGCGELLVGERYPQVTLVSLRPGAPPLNPQQFVELKRAVQLAWDNVRKTGTPIVLADDRFAVSTINDHGDLQRALEAHAESCLADGYKRPPPTSLPGPGEPR